MRKNAYLIYSFAYFLSIICLILGVAFIKGLTETQALIIVLIALLTFLIFTLIYIHKKRSISTRNHKIKHTRAPKAIHIIPIFISMIILISSVLSYNTYKNNKAQIPEALIEFGEKYPETAEFVKNYPKHKNTSYSTDVSAEIKQGNIPLFIQWDKRWGYRNYGSNLLALTGCGPTCMSMVVCGLTGNAKWNPYKVAKFSEEHGYYVDGQGTSWDFMTTGAELLGLTSAYGTISETYIREHLTPVTPIICSMYPGDFTYSGHFIVLTGVDANGDIILNDPNSKKNSQKHWQMDKLLPQIRSLWLYQVQ